MRTHQLVAFNTAQESDNKIHDDEVARRFGFTGGLVPGVDVYAYLTWGPVSEWGLAWLERGSVTARFPRPTYDGQLVTVEWDGDGAVRVRDPGGDVTAEGTASLLDAAATPLDRARFPLVPAPARDQRPPASPTSLAEGTAVATWSGHFRSEPHRAYLDGVRESSSLYLDLGVAHPAWILGIANWALADTVVLPPWMHVGSTVTNMAAIRDGQLVSVAGTVVAEYEKKGHRFCELDLLVTADDQPAATIHHTAIYRPRQVAAA